MVAAPEVQAKKKQSLCQPPIRFPPENRAGSLLIMPECPILVKFFYFSNSPFGRIARIFKTI
jgi:hypothetical protein